MRQITCHQGAARIFPLSPRAWYVLDAVLEEPTLEPYDWALGWVRRFGYGYSRVSGCPGDNVALLHFT